MQTLVSSTSTSLINESKREAHKFKFSHFWEILTKTRIGQTGETYLVNKDGVLLSPSRFRDELVRENRIENNLPEAENFKIEIPGSKTNIMLESLKMAQSGCHIQGYLDYRGIEVIGCWKWLEALGIGVVSEIDTSEAFAPFRKVQKDVYRFSGIMYTLILIGLIFVYRNFVSLFLSLLSKKNKAIKAEEKAVQALEIKNRFVANMSHEIRTPLNGIIGGLQLLGEAQLPKEQKKIVKSSIDSSINLKILLDEILQYSNIESNNTKIKNNAFNFKDSIQKTINQFKPQADNGKIKLSLYICKTIPKIIKADEVLIGQILSNFISNAIKFTPANGKVELRIEKVNSSVNEIRMRFTISDNGIGIAKDSQERIFDAFNQDDTSKTRKFGGTGLGLAISARLVQIMKGTIRVESELDKGSNFHIELPLEIGREEEIEIEKSVNQLEKISVLLAEDNSTNQLVASTFLKKLGVHYDIVNNGKEAIEAVRNKKYDLIFMDIQMPEVNGIDASKAIVDEFKENAPIIIALTANAFNEEREMCFKAGMKDFICKPFSKEDLRKVLLKYA